MTSIVLLLVAISLNLSFIGSYLMRICKCLENKENSDKEKGE